MSQQKHSGGQNDCLTIQPNLTQAPLAHYETNTTADTSPQVIHQRFFFILFTAPRQGFEPRFLGPEPSVLPLDDLGIVTNV
jgi:hypothetical protein